MAAKKQRYYRPLQPAEYADTLKTHGLRVANRLALAHMPLSHRRLEDFYLCYGPETGLKPHELCWTNLQRKFDPSGWFAHYAEGKPAPLWPAPEGTSEMEGVSKSASGGVDPFALAAAADTDVEHEQEATPAAGPVPDEAAASRALDAEIESLFDKFISASTAGDLSTDMLAAATRLLDTGHFAAGTTRADIAGWLADGIKAHK